MVCLLRKFLQPFKLLFKSHEKFRGRRGGGGMWNDIVFCVLFIIFFAN
jgi:hypothetical protein